MKVYQVPVCIHCWEQADWHGEHGWWCINENKELMHSEVEWIKTIALLEKDER